MTQVIHQSISSAIRASAAELMYYGRAEEHTHWQGKDVAADPQKQMWELLFHSIRAPIPHDRETLAKETGANLPWAEDHFQERICGQPLNPGQQYKNWPYYVANPSNDQSRVVGGEKFHHTYMERFWPKRAGLDIHRCHCDGDDEGHEIGTQPSDRFGIRFGYGDFRDVLNKLAVNPSTRQAYLPIWFPEDTGKSDEIRVPCTLGYLFMVRNGLAHCTYYIRSCDFMRHFRDDIYLACRLVHTIMQYIGSHTGNGVRPGFLHMHIGSLHCFRGEQKMLKYHI